MKKRELRGYLKGLLSDYLQNYYKVNFRLSYLEKQSKNDVRLAELSQAYYFANDSDKALVFNKFVYEKYSSKEEFLNSNSKYVVEYKNYLNEDEELKNLYRKKLLEYFDQMDLSMYRVSKKLNTNQSNVSKFFKENNNSALSLAKLKKLLRLLQRTRKYNAYRVRNVLA